MLPRWVSQTDGKYSFSPPIKIRDDKDVYYAKLVVSGEIISNEIMPLIFDKGDGLNYYRSIPFYKLLNGDVIKGLNDDQRVIMGIGIRDLYYAHVNDLLEEDTISLIKEAVDHLEPSISLNINGLNVSPWPTQIHKALRYLQIEINGENYAPYFLQINDCKMVFVDPASLSYHNMENIIDLGYRLHGSHFYTNDFNQISDGIYSCKIRGDLAKLLKIHEDNYYLQPIGKHRGGRRMIFSSTALARKLTNILLAMGPFHDMKSVNHVFRLNSFKPGDEPFYNHWDIPFYDSIAKVHSRYTILIYLTGGNGECLDIMDRYVFKGMEPMTCVIFDQKYEHTGKPYLDNEKVFIRGELLYCYNEGELGEDLEAARMFNIACYTSVKSLFQPDLDAYTAELFNQSSRMRHGMMIANKRPYRYFLKINNSVDYITNGHDYYFDTPQLKIIALVILMDYFTCRKISCCQIEDFDCEKVNEYLSVKGEYYDKLLDAMIKNGQTQISDGWIDKVDIRKKFPKIGPIKCRDNRCCCDDHCHCEPCHNRGTVRAWNGIRKLMMDEFDKYSVLLFDGRVKISLDDIIIEDHLIRFAQGMQDRIFYAACGNYGYGNPVKPIKRGFNGFNLPPIYYARNNGIIHCTIDLFHNGWVNKVAGNVKVPQFVMNNDKIIVGFLKDNKI